MTLIDHAIRLAEELDAPVFPVRVYPDPDHAGRTKKQPLVRSWQNGGAASDPEAIAHLFGEHPNATHAGIQTGRLLLVDLDGEAAQRWWQEHADILPPTRTQQTHREGGLHLFYRLPEGIELRNSAGQIAPGVDIRASGGFACDWSRDYPPAVEEVAEAPAGLIAYIRNAKQTPAAPDRPEVEHGAAISAGRRNDYLSREAFRLRKQGSSVAQILAILRALNTERCNPPLSEAELQGIVEGKRGIEAEPEVAEGGLTEDGLARWFASYRPDYRRVHEQNRWLRWDGTRWCVDRTARMYAEVREFLRERAIADAPDNTTKRRLRSAQTVAAVERLCQSHQPWATVPADWDADPWIIGTPAGVLDLRTGELSPSDPTHLITKQTAVSPAGECPLWTSFLWEVSNRDVELVAFLQRMAGYMLTGSTREHALFFQYGTGRNGKGVFISTLAGILADYATTAPMETFTESIGDRHPTDLAGLMGARLVTATETEEGRAWNESRIKALTGGDQIAARFMRGDFFQFTPSFKLLIAGNHRPRLRCVDEAMRARLHLVPFTVTIPAEKRDPDLVQKLRAEWPGILNWALAGCLDYQAQGLAPPESVRQATESYFGVQDTFGSWLADCCELGPDKWDPPTRLFASWKRYADANGERIGSQAQFTDRMESAGFRQIRDRQTRRWTGIAAKSGTGYDDA